MTFDGLESTPLCPVDQHSHSMCPVSRPTVQSIVTLISPLLSARQHLSYGDCLEVKREYYQNCSVLHTHVSSSYRSSRLGLSHWDPYAMHRGGCLELYYCNMVVEWSWWDSSLICKTYWFPSVL